MADGGARVAALYRHPVKSLGHEALDRVALTAGATVPHDREWALAHAGSRFDFEAPAWTPCSAFLRVTTTPAFAAVSAAFDEATGRLRFSHPARPDIEIEPETPADEARLMDWAAALVVEGRPRPVRLARAPGRGMTDTPAPTVSIKSMASLRALSQRVGQALDPRRFRGNVWVEGLAPWEEFDLVGREIAVGGARLKVTERVGRCNATCANPESGRFDADILGALERGWGHTDFGVYAEVAAGGEVAVGDPVST